MSKKPAAAENGWWSELDDEVLACLKEGPKSIRDLARRLAISPASATSVLLMLAAQGKVRITGEERCDTA